MRKLIIVSGLLSMMCFLSCSGAERDMTNTLTGTVSSITVKEATMSFAELSSEEMLELEKRLDEEFREIETLESDMRRVVSGNIYELTANQFVKGLDRELTEEEIRQISDYLKEGIEVRDVEIPEKGKFIITLYDETDMEICAFMIDPDGLLYAQDGLVVRDDMIEFCKSLTYVGKKE